LPLLSALGAQVDAELGTLHHVGAPLELPLAGDGTTFFSVDSLASATLLGLLLTRRAADGGSPAALLLGITAAPLHAPGVGPVFGEAAVGAGCAVVGLARLDAASDCGGDILIERAGKLCIHECAHAVGLEHCANPACVMYPARDIADLDRKARGFCARCRADHAHATLDAVRG
jgi:predicted Zn-dependent protease